jgi:hypothetical protein
MYRTHTLQKMVSTSHGQRRILKKSVPVAKYIRQAVESGTYPLSQQEEEQQQQRKSNKAPYGSNFRDLPIEYEILTLYPPIPPPPRLALKERARRQKDSRVPTEKLVLNFLKRQQQMNHPHGSLTTEEYYDRLLGIIPPPSKMKTAMGNKSALLNKAYAFALRQYEIMRKDDSITEQESIDMVNQLLEQEKKTKRYASRKTSNALREWRHQNESKTSDGAAIATNDGHVEETTSSTTFEYPTDDTTSLPSILHSKPRAIEGMNMWSQRLRAVPYREWTIGASTALDHWIARVILELEEDVWQALLQGDYSASVRSQGNDIIAVRQSLFPETILDGSSSRSEISVLEQEEQQQQEQQQTSSGYWEEDKSIDELLKSLQGFDDDDDASGSYWPSSSAATGDKGRSDDDLDSKVQKLVGELQEWRQRNVDSPYEEWLTHEKDEFAVRVFTFVLFGPRCFSPPQQQQLTCTFHSLLAILTAMARYLRRDTVEQERRTSRFGCDSKGPFGFAAD